MSQLILDYKLLLKYLPDLKIISVAVLYFISAQLGYFLTFQDTHVLAVWPPSGVGFALIILLGRSAWPGITIGALIVNLMAFWNNQSLPQATLISISTFIAIGHTLEVLVGNLLLKIWIKNKYPFSHTKHSFRFLFVTLLMCLIGACISTISIYVNGAISSDAVVEAGFRWWIGNVTGILLFTPLILAAVQKRNIHFQSAKMIEGLIFLLIIIGVYFLVRFGNLSSTLINSFPYLVIPFLLWLAFRFDLLGAIAVALAASLLAIYFTIQGYGPFIQAIPEDSILMLQIFIGVMSISSIVLSATVAEREAAQHTLREFNTNLETMVQQRTRALNDEITTRKDAEEKLTQTNQELSKRNTELDNFVYSVSHDLRAPIASVLGLLNLAKKDKDLAMRNLYLEKITESALQQDLFIKEILDQSRNSRLEVRKEEILFEPLIDETFNQLKFATSTGIAVEKIIHVNQAFSFYSDKWRLKVILNNIISNSIRYRNGRQPVIKVNVDIRNHKAIVEVEDNGRGIPREHLHKVYQMFYRATDDGAGSGLGLYIVKETIDKLQGIISIESIEGEGTKVKLEIPELL